MKMIFVTVGTHEQQFNRLIKCIDILVEDGTIIEEVIMQTGFSTYEPKHCTWRKLLPYAEMVSNVEKARVVITHGGPASFIMPLQFGKIPIVVPRQKDFDEHVNNHQVDFVKAVKERHRNIISVFDLNEIGNVICNYNSIIDLMPNKMLSNNAEFNEEFSIIVKEICK